jgi:protocatechuate 3,4-dioxygenase alpha subunit
MNLAPTPGQTVGPFFGYALPYGHSHELVEPGTTGAVRLHGVVLDGHGHPVPDALIEIWQPDPSGRVVQRTGSIQRDGTFTGWGRAATDAEGRYWFRTLEPGPTDVDRPAFFAVAVFARGLLDRLFTRAYLPDDPSLGADPFLVSIEPDRRSTVIARREAADRLRFDIVLQGAGETVFLAYGPAAEGDGAGA